MFEVGDLVRFKPSSIVQTRYHPQKKVGIVVEIEREFSLSYTGEADDMVVVLWLPMNEKERMLEFYLNKVEDEHARGTSDL